MDGAVTAPGGPALWMAAEDLRRLIALHDREPDVALVESLRARPMRHSFGMLLGRDDAIQSMALIEEIVADFPVPLAAASLEGLVAEFAAIHRENLYRARPLESDWVTGQDGGQDGTQDGQKSGLEADLRHWREVAGVSLSGILPADHLVAELRILATLLQRGKGPEATAFLEHHLLRWVPLFCGRIATRCRDPFYAGVAILTNAYLDHLRDWLGEVCDLPRRPAEPDPVDRRRRWSQDPRPRASLLDV